MTGTRVYSYDTIDAIEELSDQRRDFITRRRLAYVRQHKTLCFSLEKHTCTRLPSCTHYAVVHYTRFIHRIITYFHVHARIIYIYYIYDLWQLSGAYLVTVVVIVVAIAIIIIASAAAAVVVARRGRGEG